jgi:hypothetical protein
MSRLFRAVAFTLVAALLAATASHFALAKKPGGGGGVNRSISVEWRRDVWQAPEIRLMDETGNNRLTVNGDPDLRRGGYPRWSPDGLRLGGYYKDFFDGSDYRDTGLMHMRSDGTDERTILLRSKFEAYNVSRGYLPLCTNDYCYFGLETAAWSMPDADDGQFMVFAGYLFYPRELFTFTFPHSSPFDPGRRRLFTVEVDTGAISPVTERRLASDIPVGADVSSVLYDDFDPHWSWALNKIVFVSDRTGFDELWAINPDGTGLEQITDFQSVLLEFPAWNPTGTAIAVAVDQGRVPHDHGLWRVDYPSGAATVVRDEAAGVTEEMAAWAPTGDGLVFARYWQGSRTYTYQIVIVDLMTDNETILVNSTKQAVYFPDWKP